MRAFGVVAVLLSALVLAARAENYEGYKLYKLSISTDDQRNIIKEIALQDGRYDFINHDKVFVPPHAIKDFEKSLQRYNIDFELLNDNVGKTIQFNFQHQRLMQKLKPYRSQQRLTNDRYYSHEEINEYLDDLAEKYPQRVFVKVVGNSFEDRLLKTITITNGDGRNNKNVIFVDAGIHAREWIAPSVALYAIEELVENFDQNKDLLQDFDWVIMPLVNPDGYEYSQLSPDTRLWRKTRKPLFHQGEICYGTDANRNFGFHWNEAGSSPDPCSLTYSGPKAFSEPETVVLRDLIHSYSEKGQMYLTLHSEGEMILYPWGWTSDLPETWQDLHEVAKAGCDAIFAATGTNYTIGSSTNVLYIAAGGSDDYAFNAGFPISFTMELPGAGNGFDPPLDKIDMLVKETWVGIRAMAMKVIEKYPLNV